MTDEGWRGLKVIDFPVERRKPEHTPFIQLHSFTNLSPPLISLFYQPVPKRRLIKNPASPRGKPRGGSGSCFRATYPVVPEVAGRQVGAPYRGGAELRACTIQWGTPPQLRCAQQLPQRWSQGHFVPAGHQIGDPYSERCNIIGLHHITGYTPSATR